MSVPIRTRHGRVPEDPGAEGDPPGRGSAADTAEGDIEGVMTMGKASVRRGSSWFVGVQPSRVSPAGPGRV
ncbi:hypothetical protein Ppa05_36470 [Planomonospora parontospora subsp. antibiotica]|nr:hypothetical protein Ppa05_36470 [Planomonospora parontospora subsp. antibiotica]